MEVHGFDGTGYKVKGIELGVQGTWFREYEVYTVSRVSRYVFSHYPHRYGRSRLKRSRLERQIGEDSKALVRYSSGLM